MYATDDVCVYGSANEVLVQPQQKKNECAYTKIDWQHSNHSMYMVSAF